MSAARMLFACRPLEGHYAPLVPLASSAKSLGHAVAFATGEPYVARARADGFDAFHAGPDESFRGEWAARFPGFDRLVGNEQRRFFFTEIFANLELAPRARDLGRIVDAWRPDVVVHEVAELAAPLVCSARGIPYADVSYGALIDLDLVAAAGQAAAPQWKAHGLEPHPTAGLFRHLYVDTCPPSLQNHEIALIGPVQPLRPAAADIAGTDVPDWLAALADRPTVYLTMGTVWNQNLGLFRCVIDALRDEEVALIVTVGRQNDPAALGPQPDNVVVQRFVPQGVLLPRCDAVITHGGSGTTLGALACGRPLLVLPQGADQYANADRIVAAGAGRQLVGQQITTPNVRSAVDALLNDADYRHAAERVQTEIYAMPGPAEILIQLEELATLQP